MNQQIAPAIRPVIELVKETRQPSGIEQIAAVCKVPGCSWRYANVVKVAVLDEKKYHAHQHRARVPGHWVKNYAAGCDCGWQRLCTTKKGIREEMRTHLSDTHGVIC